jgi:predicted dehydrogenase/nucleoside-diphosphate-sugar epimerase
MSIRVAFVGAGRMARLHLHALRRVRTAHVVAGVYDPSARAARELAALAGAVAYTSLADLLHDARPELVHVCTPAGTHFEPARDALLAGAHVYVEKPFVETEREAREMLRLAEQRALLVCAGHQQVRDAAYRALLGRLSQLGAPVQMDCHFAFRPVSLDPERAGPRVLATQLLDILPHPLYTLIAALEAVTPDPEAIDLVTVVAGPADLHAVLQASEVYGRLSVSLRARPVSSMLTVTGSAGALTADFIRTSVVGAANSGTGPIEKAANPLLEGWQMAVGGAAGAMGRLVRGGDYPGLAELIGDFYDSVVRGGPSPLSPEHLRRVAAIYEELAFNVRDAAARAAVQRPSLQKPAVDAPLAIVTGARGFFGREITRALARRGYRVRGISRSPDTDDPHVHEWYSLDLSRDASRDAFADAAVVVHAAVDTSGGYDGHQRNTIDATRNVLRGLHAAGVTRLVYVSSLSVLRPPRTPWERQDEQTPLAGPGARALGPYTWGKCEAERLVAAEAAALGIDTRILRPAALLDWTKPEVPGLVGRRLFGRWHLGFGRPELPFAACEVGRAAAVVAWCAARFDEAPRIVHVIGDEVSTRGQLIESLRSRGWRGRMVWLPISLVASLVVVARTVLALAHFRLPPRLAAWSLLRPRRYDTSLANRTLAYAESPRDGCHGTVAVAATPHAETSQREPSGPGRPPAECDLG